MSLLVIYYCTVKETPAAPAEPQTTEEPAQDTGKQPCMQTSLVEPHPRLSPFDARP